jgi:DNA-binding beta-propeller fold protein YncE
LVPGVATDGAGDVYVADYFNGRMQKFTGTGTYLTRWGSQGSGDGQFFFPWGAATAGGGAVYITDLINDRIQEFIDPSTPTQRTTWGRLKRLYR